METGDRRYSRIKDIHIEVCLNRNVESVLTTGLEAVELPPGFPTFGVSEIDTSATLLGRMLSLPLIISPITGGGKESLRINRNLAPSGRA